MVEKRGKREGEELVIANHKQPRSSLRLCRKDAQEEAPCARRGGIRRRRVDADSSIDTILDGESTSRRLRLRRRRRLDAAAPTPTRDVTRRHADTVGHATLHARAAALAECGVARPKALAHWGALATSWLRLAPMRFRAATPFRTAAGLFRRRAAPSLARASCRGCRRRWARAARRCPSKFLRATSCACRTRRRA